MRTSSFFAKRPTGLKRAAIERIVTELRWGIHRSIFSGKGVDFRRFRPYTPLDRPTSIDDLASHRLSQDPEFEPYVRETYTTKKVSVLVLLDVGETMQALPLKEERAATLFWFFALSAFKHYDDFRVVPYGPNPFGDSGWVNGEERLTEYISSFVRSSAPTLRLSRFVSVYSYLPKLELHDAVVFIISDFAHPWRDESTLLRRLGGRARNLKIVFCVIDEWEEFDPPPYAMTLYDPRTLVRRECSPGELRGVRADALTHFAAVEESVRPIGISVVRIPISTDPLSFMKRSLHRLGLR